jgi:ATP-dependent Clp protease ATP-binding subunit ClpA
VIQEHIKKPLADEVLFGKLKGGGHVRVVLVTEQAEGEPAKEKIGFEFVEGPVKPKPEKLPVSGKRKPPKSGGPGPGSSGPKGPLSKGPLVKA